MFTVVDKNIRLAFALTALTGLRNAEAAVLNCSLLLCIMRLWEREQVTVDRAGP